MLCFSALAAFPEDASSFTLTASTSGCTWYSNDCVRFTWSSAPGGQHVSVYLQHEENSITQTQYYITNSLSGREFWEIRFSDLTDNTKFRFRLRVQDNSNSYSNSDWSNEITKGTPPEPSVCASQSTTALQGDCAVLETLYDDAGGDNWKTSTNWKTANPLGQWYGIKVSGGRVTEIELDDNQLTGTISTGISALAELNGLYLEDNSLSGTIPSLSSLTKLNGLYLSNNRLSGEIPDLSSTSLSVLYLDGNSLSGTIPDLSNLDHLTTMDLSENSLSGPVPDLSSTRMQSLHLSDNQLTGTFSASSLPAVSICVVDLSNNRLSGTIPDLSSLTGLCELNLKGNSYSGTISASLFPSGGRRGVQLIDLSNNSLSGTIPDLTSTGVTYLYLSNNSFSGTINPSFGSDNGLRDLDLSNNSLSGTIPPITSGGLNYLLLQNNNLTGTIPDLSSSRYLVALGLWGNSVTGDITVHSDVNLGQAGDRSALWVLYEATGGKNWKNAATNGWFTSYMSNWQGVTLSNGRVTGLDLSGNGLTGSVGNSLQVLSVLTTLDLSCNSSLTGQLPLELKDIDTLTSVNICSTGVTSPGDQSFTDWKNGSDVTFTDGTCSPACPQSASQQSVSPQSSPPASPESSPPAGGVGGGNGENEAENVPPSDSAVPSGEGDSGEEDIEAGGGCALVSGTEEPPGAAFSLFLAAAALLAVSCGGSRSRRERLPL